MKKSLLFAVLTFVCLSTGLVAQEQLSSEQEKRIQKLEQIIEEQQARIDQLQARIPAPEEKALRESARTSDIADGTPEVGYEARGFFIRVPNVELYLSGSIQMGLAIFENDTPDNNSFYPNGVVLATDVYFYEAWHGRLEVNLHKWSNNVFQSCSGGVVNADGVQLWDAYIEYMFKQEGQLNPLIALRVGQFHVPFTMEGQYNPNATVAIWTSPAMAAWSHGRDPGIMLWGVISDMFEYKLSVHNGEGATTLNGTDDMLMAAGFRVYPMKKSENPNTFFHTGVIRSRDNRLHQSNDISSASLRTPWNRPVFDGVWGTDWTQGWKTGVDTAFRFDMDMGPDKKSNLRIEGEFIYMMWERDFKSTSPSVNGRYPFLHGYGFVWSMMYRHNLNPEIPGEGIFPIFQFSYSDVDNKDTDSNLPGGDILGQTVTTYTFGLGYAFNKYISVQFNWVMVDLSEQDVYGPMYGGNAAKDDRYDGSDDIEHAWFLQFTATW